MKITIDRITKGEDEVILRYITMTDEIKRILSLLQPEKRRLIGRAGSEQVVLDPDKVLYFESVDNATYAYTKHNVYRIEYTLSETEVLFREQGFFRCSKSMIINLCKVASLKSLSCNRIDAKMENEEHVVISRTYATEFRRVLKGGNQDE